MDRRTVLQYAVAVPAMLALRRTEDAGRPVELAGRQPQLAAHQGRVLVTFGRENGVFAAASADGGVSFDPPVPIATPGVLSLGMHRGPRIAASSRAVVVAAVAGVRGGGADGDVRLWRSTDAGRTWSGTRSLNDVPGAAREGLHALAANDAGTMVAVWLDLRGRGTELYAAVSHDHGVGWGPNVPVHRSPSGTVCECCHPSAAVDASGAIAVMFRNSLEGARDMYATVSRDGGRTFEPAEKQGRGSWALKACPMDGGDIAWIEGRIASVWRREGSIFLVHGGGGERLVGEGTDPAMGVAGAALDLAWSTPGGIMLQRGGAAARAIGPGRFPALLALGSRTVVACEDARGIRVYSVAR